MAIGAAARVYCRRPWARDAAQETPASPFESEGAAMTLPVGRTGVVHALSLEAQTDDEGKELDDSLSCRGGLVAGEDEVQLKTEGARSR